MEDLLPRLAAIVSERLAGSSDLDAGISWSERAKLPPMEQVAIAARLKSHRLRRDQDLEFVLYDLSGSWLPYARRLMFHAYWCAWNLYLDPPKKIEPRVSELTSRLQEFLPALDSPDLFVTAIRLGLDRLEYLGYPPKPLKPVRPGRRGRGM